jgi:hypothetical protein
MRDFPTPRPSMPAEDSSPTRAHRTEESREAA